MGGLYIIEDVFPHGGGIDYEENPQVLPPYTTKVLQDNHVMFIDSAVGSRVFDQRVVISDKEDGKGLEIDRRWHFSYLLIIRKRVGPVPPVQ